MKAGTRRVKLRRGKVAELQRQRDRCKAINAYARKHGGSLDGFGLLPGEAEEINTNRRIWTGVYGAPYPPYVLTNLGARIRDAEKRVQELTHLAERGTAGPTEAQVNGVEIAADPTENRVLLKYPRRLTRDEYKKVRGFGFWWDPSRDAFCRKMGGTNGAEYAAQMLAEGYGA